ncbi:MAG: 2-isopropylmalate synthase, partial [Deltaproteobacteria bacterium]|nr:2-isopropylmalate synthase [Deltaproteobacteria bacterium]
MGDFVKIFDTTLRDGEQSPGASMNVEEKVRIAKQLARLGVDVIEAGFAISSPGDFEAVRRISHEVEGPVVCSLARAKPEDVDKAYEALKGAPKPRIHTFISTSDIHLKHQFRMTREEAKKRAVEMVRRAKGYVDDVEGITDNVSNINKAVISVHCHNDLGLAVANSLAAVMNGARQVECTINGIGERAGNASLEEIVMILRTRRDILNIDTKIITEHIHPTSRLISSITGIMVQPNKAIVGDNAFAHESGIHQDGLLKDKTTYEIMRPESIGLSQSTLVMGKHSGRHAFKTRLKELGYELSEENLNKAFDRFKILADQKKEIFDEDIEAIVAEEILRIEIPERFRLEKLHVASGTETVPTAMVEMYIDGKHEKETGVGDGPVDAVYKTIAKMTGTKSRLLRYSVNAITGGTDAQGEVTV